MSLSKSQEVLKVLGVPLPPVVDAEAEVNKLSNEDLVEYLTAVKNQTELLDDNRGVIDILENSDDIDTDGIETLREAAMELQQLDDRWLDRSTNALMDW